MGSQAGGPLTLAPFPEGRARAETLPAVLAGSTSVALDSVGARRVGDPSSIDLTRPGVLVFGSAAGSEAPRILIRLGSEANRLDQQPFESAYTVLEVHAVTGEGFAGRWRSGMMDLEAEGYFCATRVTQ